MNKSERLKLQGKIKTPGALSHIREKEVRHTFKFYLLELSTRFSQRMSGKKKKYPPAVGGEKESF